MTHTEADRPRERLRRLGPAALSDAELLAVMLGTGRRGESALGVAGRLLERVGGVGALRSAPLCDLSSVAGVGPARCAQIQAAAELGIRAVTSPLEAGRRLGTSEQVYRAYGPRMRHQRREEFYCVALDSKRRVIAESCIARGHLTGVQVHPRELFRMLVREAAAAAVLVHNHPSGDPTPSREDVALTRRLFQAGLVLGIELVDHVVIGDGRFVSMQKEMGGG